MADVVVPHVRLAHVSLDLVVGLGLVARLLADMTRADVALDLVLCILPLLVRHCSSFGIPAPVRRCHIPRRRRAPGSSRTAKRPGAQAGPFRMKTRASVVPDVVVPHVRLADVSLDLV